MQKPLEKEKYREIIKNTQLISVDLLFFNKEGKLLVGKRNNNPAKSFWFTLGGRVYKHEELSNAIERIANTELIPFNKGAVRSQPMLHGVYKHTYENNFEDNEEYSTEYINFAYCLNIHEYYNADTCHKLEELDVEVADDQHACFNWVSLGEVETNSSIHNYVKCYFHPNAWNKLV